METKFYLSEPWFSLTRQGRKKIDGRPGAKSNFNKLIGSTVTFYNNNNEIKIRIGGVRWYSDIYDYLEREGHDNIFPDTNSLNMAVSIIHREYSDNDITKLGGICALLLEL